jgi:hypothetical protein
MSNRQLLFLESFCCSSENMLSLSSKTWLVNAKSTKIFQYIQPLFEKGTQFDNLPHRFQGIQLPIT